MKRILMIISVLLVSAKCIAAPFEYREAANGFRYVYHEHNEASYQKAWCDSHNGVMEYENKDFTRVDCLTDTHAVEFDFANKWAESVGQALHYGIMTGKKPMVVLILENKKQKIYFKRVKRIAKEYNFDVEYVTNELIEVKKGKCNNPECKCHQNKS